MHIWRTDCCWQLLAAMLAASVLLQARADDAPTTSAPALHVGGYGTVSGYRAGIHGASLRPDPQFAGSATDGKWAFDGDTRLAMQGRLTLPADTEAVLQVSTSNTQDHHYRPTVDWAYVDWHPSDSTTLRAGRQTLPVLRFSESRYVGYAMAAVRPQPAVYALSTGSPVDGVNFSWEHSVDEDTWRLDMGAGRSSASVGGRRIDVRRSLVAAVQWQHGAWTGRIAASEFRVDMTGFTLLPAALQSVCGNCAEIFDQRVATQDVRGTLMTTMLVWDGRPWEWSIETVSRSASSSTLLPRAQGAYVKGSRRFGRWQLQSAIGRLRYREPPLGLQASAGAPAAAQASLDALDRYLQSPNDMNAFQIGVRLDLAAGLALKLQQDIWRATRDQSTGRNGLIVLNSPPLSSTPSTWNGHAQLTTLSLNFVF